MIKIYIIHIICEVPIAEKIRKQECCQVKRWHRDGVGLDLKLTYLQKPVTQRICNPVPLLWLPIRYLHFINCF